MAVRIQFICSSCGYESAKWYGRCPSCQSWNTFSEFKAQDSLRKPQALDIASSTEPTQIGRIKSEAASRIPTGFWELDRVLGGGIVPGSAVLLSGDPGVGKSTLLLELARNIARSKSQKPIANSKVLYVSGEESEGQIKIRAERIGIKENDNLFIFSNGNLENVVSAVEKIKPSLLIIDSIQAITSADIPGFAGSLPQIRHATARIVSFAKKNNTPVFIIGHVTKEGEVAGPMLLSHMVDCVLYLETSASGDSGTRILRAFKNRFGDSSEVGIFTMEGSGMAEVSDSSFFMEKSKRIVPGSCLTVVMEGTRPIIVEIQGLVVPSNLSYPRRVSNGIFEKRIELLIAVMQKHAKIPLDRFDVYVNVVSGLRISETSSDLAVCLALVSSFKNRPVNAVAISEIGLLGELKSVLN
ncbi:MAG: DNA repair protein RadA, partial [Candidatus Levybacteria bacterium]|nr:DNA repair protein RadA [Candidatus Levybacteria bacterium]